MSYEHCIRCLAIDLGHFTLFATFRFFFRLELPEDYQSIIEMLQINFADYREVSKIYRQTLYT